MEGFSDDPIEYGIFGERSHISTNQKREIGAFLLLIGRNLIPFPDNTALYKVDIGSRNMITGPILVAAQVQSSLKFDTRIVIHTFL